MLDAATIKSIRQKAREYWSTKITEEEAVGLFQGKEIGHRIADYVDDKTTALIKVYFPVAFESDKRGWKKSRSMGDLWIKCGDIYHPVNIKTGITRSGRPNMVSLKRLLSAIILRQIDSYYLLMVKFTQIGDVWKLDDVYLVDMLDYLDCVDFNSGPGQMMLKPDQFYARLEKSGYRPRRPLLNKAGILMDMLEKADKRLIVSRESKRRVLKTMLNEYEQRGHFEVSPETQKDLKLNP